MKTENWNGHSIRFVEHGGEWWAVSMDITTALGYQNNLDALRKHVDPADKNTIAIRYGIRRGNPNKIIINEFGIYSLIFGSDMPKAKEFQRWVFGVIKNLREQAGLEGFEVFRMMDKRHQLNMMGFLNQNIKQTRRPTQKDFIVANVVANKAVSNRHGYPKMVKKGDMSPQMLKEREPVLEDVVTLMSLKERYGMDVSISDTIYGVNS